MRLNTHNFRHILSDILCAALALFFAVFLRFDMRFSEMVGYFEFASPAFFITLPVLTIVFGLLLGRYNAMPGVLSVRDIFVKSASSVLAIIFTYIAHKIFNFPISLSISLIFTVSFFIFTVVMRYIEYGVKIRNSQDSKQKADAKRAIIVGAGNAGSSLIQLLLTSSNMTSYPVALCDDNPSKRGMTLSGVRVMGKISDIARIAKETKAEEIIIAIPSASARELNTIFDKCKACNLPIKTFGSLVDFNDYMSGAKKSLKNLSIEDLLFRDSIKTDMNIVADYIKGKTVLVTGGAGSIGSEICRQVLEYGCKFLVIMDINENGLFFLRNDLLTKYDESRFAVRVGSVRDKARMTYLFRRHKFDVVFHAAAHKHVPLMEDNPFEAIKNNVFGTKNTVECCIENGTERFVFISTDKAVNPTNVMGATKRAAELVVQRYNGRGCELSAVRFGNVLGSNGSVIPIFRKQIEEGGPVTVTHRNIIRYFMTIPEAVSLVLSAGVSAKKGEIFVLDMGEPVSIYELACNMISLAGLRLHEDIEIEFTGLRPGEKMFEEIRLDTEKVSKTDNDKIFIMQTEPVTEKVDADLSKLSDLLASDCGEEKIREALFDMISIDFEKSVEQGSNIEGFLEHAEISN